MILMKNKIRLYHVYVIYIQSMTYMNMSYQYDIESIVIIIA